MDQPNEPSNLSKGIEKVFMGLSITGLGLIILAIISIPNFSPSKFSIEIPACIIGLRILFITFGFVQNIFEHKE